MDIATILGLVLGCTLVLLGIGPANLSYFIDIRSVIMVIGGTIAAVLIAYPFSTVLSTMGVVMKTILIKPINLTEIIDNMVEFATIARKDGLLALEEKLETLESPIMKRGTQMIIDGVEEQRAQSAKQPLAMGIALHPYIVGQPHRLRPLRTALEHIAGLRDEIWLCTSGEIAAHWEETSPPT